LELNGKVALITGGGTGLGREVSLALAKEGMHLAIGYSRSRADAEQLVTEVRETGGSAAAFQADLNSPEQSRALIQAVGERFQRLDLLIHNAATTRFVPFKDLDAVEDDAWDEIMSVNLKSAFVLAKAAAPLLRADGGGQIISTSSIAGIAPVGSSIPYAVSKAGLIHLTKCLAVALAPEIQVNTVAPGLLLTRWVAGFSEEHIQGMTDTALLKHCAELQDVAGAFVMLAKNTSITGQAIVIDSGQLMR
jgi:3-oxoacyl-[acyl-carrier protein] reductase